MQSNKALQGSTMVQSSRVLWFERKKWNAFWSRYGLGYLFIAPFVIFLMIFTIGPVITAITYSLTNFNFFQPATWIGLENFRVLLTQDDVFMTAFKNTFIFACILGPIGYVSCFLLAWVINSVKLRNVFAIMFYVPSIAGSAAISVVWSMLFSSDKYGYVNYMLKSLNVIQKPILWMNDPSFIPVVYMIMTLWAGLGSGFLVHLAGLNTIPKSLYEAAAIDGVQTKTEELWYITIPRIKPQLLLVAIQTIVSSMSVFVNIGGFPTPNYSGHTIMAHMYDYAFIRFQIGYSSAISIVLFILTFTLSRISMRVLKSKD